MYLVQFRSSKLMCQPVFFSPPDKGDMYAGCTFFFFFFDLSSILIILIFQFKTEHAKTSTNNQHCFVCCSIHNLAECIHQNAVEFPFYYLMKKIATIIETLKWNLLWRKSQQIFFYLHLIVSINQHIGPTAYVLFTALAKAPQITFNPTNKMTISVFCCC